MPGSLAGHRFVACEWEISSTKHPRPEIPARKKATAVCAFSYNLRRRGACDLNVLRPDVAPWGQHLAGRHRPLQLSWWITIATSQPGKQALCLVQATNNAGAWRFRVPAF